MISSFIPDMWQCCSVAALQCPCGVVPPLLVLAPSPVVHWMVPELLFPILMGHKVQGSSALGSAPHEQDQPPMPLQWTQQQNILWPLQLQVASTNREFLNQTEEPSMLLHGCF